MESKEPLGTNCQTVAELSPSVCATTFNNLLYQLNGFGTEHEALVTFSKTPNFVKGVRDLSNSKDACDTLERKIELKRIIGSNILYI